MDICYSDDPRKPMVILLSRILANPYEYKRYILPSTPESVEIKAKKIKLMTELQVVKFLNDVYLPDAQPNNLAYSEMEVSINMVFNTVNLYSDVLIDKSVVSFATWCKKKGVLLYNAPFTRKRQKNCEAIATVRSRKVYVLKQEYLDNLVEAIVNYIPEFQLFISTLKRENYTIVGYARKSKGNETEEVRDRLLNQMVDCLQSRAKVDMVFASTCCKAASPLASRDLKGGESIAGVRGNTQDLIRYLNTTSDRVCLVIIDYSGLSTNADDLWQFISDHERLEMIIVDRLPFNHETVILNRQTIIEDPSILSAFDCRTNTNQRSKKI